MNIEENSLQQLDLEYITAIAVRKRMESLDSLNMHDFLTAIEGLLPAYSVKFLIKLKREFKIGADMSSMNSRDFMDTIKCIDGELKGRNHG